MSTYTLALTGDSLITRPLSVLDDPELAALRNLVETSDVAFTNLEFICATPPLVPRARWHGLHVYTTPKMLDELKRFGFNLFSLAHNHTMDYSARALEETLQALADRNMVCAGAGTTLTEARRPRYLDARGVRASIIAACTTDGTATIAADPDGVIEGRPGISALRWSTRYELTADLFDALADIDESLGTASGTRMAQALSISLDHMSAAGDDSATIRFLGADFVRSAETRIATHPNQADVDDISRWIRDAKHQSGLVIVSLHCHEGANGQYNQDTTADFALEAARHFIDVGADVFVGHGPHQLCGMEVYKGKPIFHSLGNLVFMPETVETLPWEFLEAAGLPRGATAADFQNMREGTDGDSRKGFTGLTAYWESVVPKCEFTNGALTQITLWPIVLENGPVVATRGSPRLTTDAEGASILERFASLAEPFGTSIRVDRVDGRLVGTVAL